MSKAVERQQINLQELQALLGTVAREDLYLTALSASSSLSQTRVKSLKQMTPAKIRSIVGSKVRVMALQTHQQQTVGQQTPIKWKAKESLTFEWLALNYCYVYRQKLQCLNIEGMRFLMTYCPGKPLYFLKYHLISISKGVKKHSEWSEQQIDSLCDLMDQTDSQYSWNTLAYTLFERVKGRFFKTDAACRQMWHNHLCPDLRKTEWTPDEDCLLVETVKEVGRKWSRVAVRFGGSRNCHMVKNRFNFLVKQKVPEHILSVDQQMLEYLYQKVTEDLRSIESKEKSFSKCGNTRAVAWKRNASRQIKMEEEDQQQGGIFSLKGSSNQESPVKQDYLGVDELIEQILSFKSEP